jgi:hypothetical protein
MRLGTEPPQLWQAHELAAILRHQLDVEVAFDLSQMDDPENSLGALSARGDRPIQSFSGLFGHDRPPMALLELTKRFAKESSASGGGTLPDEIATVLYLASIAAAATKHRHRITRLDDAALLQRLGWALEQSWLDDATRALLVDARRLVESGGLGPDG